MILVDKSENRPRGVDLLIPPHMHVRGKEMSIEAIYPDGRREVLSKVDKYDRFWQLSYQYADLSRLLGRPP